MDAVVTKHTSRFAGSSTGPRPLTDRLVYVATSGKPVFDADGPFLG
jgi:hypothetical protein